MAQFATDSSGFFDDRVRLVLGGEDLFIAESYDVSVGVLQQPARFSLTLGSSVAPKAFLKKYPPRTPFKLFIGDVQQQTGFTDGEPSIERSSSGTTLTIHGRDMLAPLHDGHVEHEVSLSDETYKSLVEKIVAVVFATDKAIFGGVPPKVLATNAGSRKVRSGVPIQELAPPKTIDEILLGGSVGFSVGGVAHMTQQAKLGETHLSLIRRYLDRAGLMLWAGPDGNYVLSAPNGVQKPTYQIIVPSGASRTTDASNGAGNVISTSKHNDTLSRFSTVAIYSKSGGKKFGRAKGKGASADAEMVSWGYNKPLVIRDANCKTVEQAEYLAARKLAEGARSGWKLEYKLSGHTAPSLVGGGRAVWTPDTVVHVEDDDLGVSGDFYLEDVNYRRGPDTTTTLRFMRTQDLIFGADEAS